jgi:hypothetical protein
LWMIEKREGINVLKNEQTNPCNKADRKPTWLYPYQTNARKDGFNMSLFFPYLRAITTNSLHCFKIVTVKLGFWRRF